MSRPSSVPPREFTGKHMLFVMLGFFGVVVGVNVTMAVLSSRTWTGLVVENSYVASQEFNCKQHVALEQQAMGWQGRLAYAGGQLRFTLTDGSDRPLPAESVQLALSRPIGVAGDQTLMLERQADGSFTSPAVLGDGVWNGAIVAQFAGAPDHEHRARLVIANGRSTP